MTKTCRECRFSRDDLQPPLIHCTAHPPLGFLVPAGGVNGPMVVSQYPSVNPDVPCGEFLPKVEKPQLAKFPSEGSEKPCDVEP